MTQTQPAHTLGAKPQQTRAAQDKNIFFLLSFHTGTHASGFKEIPLSPGLLAKEKKDAGKSFPSDYDCVNRKSQLLQYVCMHAAE
jgi:hypothetical protein